jgi:hypothetical protein
MLSIDSYKKNLFDDAFVCYISKLMDENRIKFAKNIIISFFE